MQNTSNRLVKQLEVVTNYEKRTFIGAQKFEHPSFCINVKVVSWFV